jgi:hypothetical protein
MKLKLCTTTLLKFLNNIQENDKTGLLTNNGTICPLSEKGTSQLQELYKVGIEKTYVNGKIKSYRGCIANWGEGTEYYRSPNCTSKSIAIGLAIFSKHNNSDTKICFK